MSFWKICSRWALSGFLVHNVKFGRVSEYSTLWGRELCYNCRARARMATVPVSVCAAASDKDFPFPTPSHGAREAKGGEGNGSEVCF
jgi:hypothetical protein